MPIHILKIRSSTSSLIATSYNIGVGAWIDLSVTLNKKKNVLFNCPLLENHCIIGNKCRSSGSIIEDECILENVIVGPNARFGKKSKLTNSYVEGNYVVESKSMIKGETLMKVIEDYNKFDWWWLLCYL